MISYDLGGEPDRDMVGSKLVFDGDKFTLKPKQPDGDGRFVLDAGTKPKQVDPIAPNDKKTLGIYELDGDTSKLCFHKRDQQGTRPAEFVSKKGSDAVLAVLRRDKK